jgi:hypothetical protein
MDKFIAFVKVTVAALFDMLIIIISHALAFIKEIWPHIHDYAIYFWHNLVTFAHYFYHAVAIHLAK